MTPKFETFSDICKAVEKKRLETGVKFGMNAAGQIRTWYCSQCPLEFLADAPNRSAVLAARILGLLRNPLMSLENISDLGLSFIHVADSNGFPSLKKRDELLLACGLPPGPRQAAG